MAVPLFCGQEAGNRNEFSSTFAPGTCEFEIQRAMVSNFNRELRTNEEGEDDRKRGESEVEKRTGKLHSN